MPSYAERQARLKAPRKPSKYMLQRQKAARGKKSIARTTLIKRMAARKAANKGAFAAGSKKRMEQGAAMLKFAPKKKSVGKGTLGRLGSFIKKGAAKKTRGAKARGAKIKSGAKGAARRKPFGKAPSARMKAMGRSYATARAKSAKRSSGKKRVSSVKKMQLAARAKVAKRKSDIREFAKKKAAKKRSTKTIRRRSY